MTDEDRPRRRARPLRDDERKLWSAVARSVKPLKPGRAEDPSASEPPKPDEPPVRLASATSPPPRPKPKSGPPPLAPLGRRVRQRLGRGTEPIDRRIDLHGMTQREAHDALVHVLRSAQASGAKTVLVITGKGARAGRDPLAERGVLRRLVPQWLGQPELRAIVLGFEPAGVGHGGEGALYVRLRRAKRAP